MIRYVFRDAPVAIKAGGKANAQKIGEELQAITDANKGRLTPKDVVERARNPRNTLHKHFEWDDAKAADAHRLEQARELIRVVRVEDEAHSEPVRAFLSLQDNGVAYRSVGEVQSSPALQEIVLKQALRDLRAFEQRYRDMKDVCEDIREAQRKVGAKLKAAETRAAA